MHSNCLELDTTISSHLVVALFTITKSDDIIAQSFDNRSPAIPHKPQSLTKTDYLNKLTSYLINGSCFTQTPERVNILNPTRKNWKPTRFRTSRVP